MRETRDMGMLPAVTVTVAQTVGRFRVHERIAAGGMGEVYRASMHTIEGAEKDVALKVVRAQLAAETEFAELFVTEAKIAMTLSHANIVHSFDVGKIDDRWFLAMEFVDGVNLAVLIEECQARLHQLLPHRHVLFIAVEALKGLDYAHRRKDSRGEPMRIVHRDVSPGNILLSHEGEVKVADFGIAKSAIRTTASMQGTVKGKIPYMAPEQLRGHAVDRRADLYSVGAVLYEMLTGQRIVDAERGTAAIPDILEGNIPWPSVVNPAVPDKLEAIVMRALAVSADDRFANAAVMRQELEQFAMESGYLLSSTDLADFVAQIVGTEQKDESSSETGKAPTLPRAPTVPERGRTSDGFDVILGRELEKIESAESFSVFTTSFGGRVSTAPIGTLPLSRPEGASVDPIGRGRQMPSTPVAIAGLGPMRSRRWVWAGALTLGLAIISAITVASTSGPDENMGIGAPAAETDRLSLRTPPQRNEPTQPISSAIPTAEQAPIAIPPPPRPVEPARLGKRPQKTPVAPPRPEVTPAAATESAMISVNTDPWSYVAIDGVRVRSTPVLRYAVTPGNHRITLSNPAEQIERSLTVNVAAREHRRISLRLRETP